MAVDEVPAVLSPRSNLSFRGMDVGVNDLMRVESLAVPFMGFNQYPREMVSPGIDGLMSLD
jgi:hypothetical protein